MNCEFLSFEDDRMRSKFGGGSNAKRRRAGPDLDRVECFEPILELDFEFSIRPPKVLGGRKIRLNGVTHGTFPTQSLPLPFFIAKCSPIRRFGFLHHLALPPNLVPLRRRRFDVFLPAESPTEGVERLITGIGGEDYLV